MMNVFKKALEDLKRGPRPPTNVKISPPRNFLALYHRTNRLAQS